MNLARIVAGGRNALGAQAGARLVLVAMLAQDGQLAKGSWPGYLAEDGRRWPFVLTTKEDESVVDYGSGYSAEDRIARSNLQGKPLKPGELFTAGAAFGSRVYEVLSCHRFTASTPPRMATVRARCIDAHRRSGHDFVLLCAVDASLRIQEGEWLGYALEGGSFEPFMFSPPKAYLDYGTDWPDYRENTDLREARVGARFVVHSTDESRRPDDWHYEVTGCELA